MANLALAWVNKADAGTWTASAQLARAPVSRLQNKHVARKWRFNATSGYAVCDLGSSQSVDTFALMGLSGVAPTLRVGVSTADSSGAARDAYDSGSSASAWDSDYLPYVRLSPSPVTGRYVRFDMLEAGVDYIEAGRGYVGLRETFENSFSPGWQRSWVDPSVRTMGRGGQTFDDLRDKYRILNLTLEGMTEANRWDIVEPIDIALGHTGDMLVMVDPDSAALSRDCIWGYLENIDPVIEPQIIQGGSLFTKTYSVRERL